MPRQCWNLALCALPGACRRLPTPSHCGSIWLCPLGVSRTGARLAAPPEPSGGDVRLAGPATYTQMEGGSALEVKGRLEYYDDPVGPFGSANFGSVCGNDFGEADAQVRRRRQLQLLHAEPCRTQWCPAAAVTTVVALYSGCGSCTPLPALHRLASLPPCTQQHPTPPPTPTRTACTPRPVLHTLPRPLNSPPAQVACRQLGLGGGKGARAVQQPEIPPADEEDHIWLSRCASKHRPYKGRVATNTQGAGACHRVPCWRAEEEKQKPAAWGLVLDLRSAQRAPQRAAAAHPAD